MGRGQIKYILIKIVSQKIDSLTIFLRYFHLNIPHILNNFNTYNNKTKDNYSTKLEFLSWLWIGGLEEGLSQNVFKISGRSKILINRHYMKFQLLLFKILWNFKTSFISKLKLIYWIWYLFFVLCNNLQW